MKPDNQNITIHIGMPKAASSTLQNNFFSQLPNINFIGINNNTIAEKLFFKAIHQDSAYFNIEKTKNSFDEILKNNLPKVFSSEMGCGPIIPLYKRIPQNRKTIALRFKKIFPDAKILIIIRNQKIIHKSIYPQHLKSISTYLSVRSLAFQKWIDLNINLYENGMQNIFDFADYYPLINIYLSLFKKVKVVVFEEMIKDFENFIKIELCPFIGIDPFESSKYFINKKENKRHSMANIIIEENIKRTLKLLDIMGSPQKILPFQKREIFMSRIRRSNNLISLGKIKTEYTDGQISFLKNFYTEGNKKISELLDLNLKKYGYWI